MAAELANRQGTTVTATSAPDARATEPRRAPITGANSNVPRVARRDDPAGVGGRGAVASGGSRSGTPLPRPPETHARGQQGGVQP
jgi:hypothetical protein